MTPTATAILVLFDRTAFSTIMVTFTFKIIRMTGSAEGREQAIDLAEMYNNTFIIELLRKHKKEKKVFGIF